MSEPEFNFMKEKLAVTMMSLITERVGMNIVV